MRIISGGQTGVDRAALDVALELGLLHGGFVPKGRKAEDGRVPEKYNLIELSSTSYPVRTRANILEADGTLILTPPRPTGGTRLTAKIAHQYDRIWLAVDPFQNDKEDHLIQRVLTWIGSHQIETLNVAGPRESKIPGIYEISCKFLRKLLEKLP